ncbi:MAG: hypothetical protein KatS3mg003_0427 [Candidatus Nitrosocaldaceae archaeon]|nr:MAG: hypothetical protein KatS3mg003_0427 [Candidatus Nitrosocaldaceae archaeon]
MSSFIGELITIGRKSKKEHKIPIRIVYYNGKYYISRRNANSDWLKNIIAKPYAKIVIDDKVIECIAKIVEDEELSRIISCIKYNDQRAYEKRIVVELKPV